MTWKFLESMDPQKLKEFRVRTAVAYEAYPDLSLVDEKLDEVEATALYNFEQRVADELGVLIPEGIDERFFSDQMHDRYFDEWAGEAVREACDDFEYTLMSLESSQSEWSDYACAMLSNAEEMLAERGEIRGMFRWADDTRYIPGIGEVESSKLASATRELMKRINFSSWAELQGDERNYPFLL